MEEAPQPAPNACISCKSPEFDPSYKVPLCNDCRNKLKQLRAPLWVKLFAAFVVLLSITGLVLVPKKMGRAIHLEKAQEAEAERRFVTAAHEYEKVVADNPHSVDYIVHLFHAYYMQADYSKAIPLINSFTGQRTQDMYLGDLANHDLDQLSLLMGDSLINVIAGENLTDSLKLQQCLAVLSTQPDNIAALYMVSNTLYDMKRFNEADTYAKHGLEKDEYNLPLLGLQAAIKREEGEYDSANYLYDRMLELNAEATAAYTGKARIGLKQHNDQKASEYIEIARKIEPENILVYEADILFLYLTGKTADANKELVRMKNTFISEEDQPVIQRVEKVLSGEVKYR